MKRIYYLMASILILGLISCSNDDTDSLVADFSCSSTSAKVGEEITFFDKSSGNPGSWSWTFEGAVESTSRLQQPVATWLEAGTYSVSLTVTNSHSTAETTKANYITISNHDSVTANFSIDKTEAFNDEYITFTNLSEGYPTDVKWTFTSDEGTVVESSEYSPSLIFDEPGVYSVKLEVSNSLASDVKQVADAFTVLDVNAVLADFTASNTVTYATGSVTFSSGATGKVGGLEWTFEGGSPSTSTEENPSVTYAETGKYTVTLKAYNDEYEHTCTKEEFVYVVPEEDLVFLLPFDGDIKDYGPYGLDPSVYSLGGLNVSYDSGHGDSYGESLQFPGGTKGSAYAVLLMPDDELEEVYPQGSDMTLSVWTNISDVSENTAVFAQGACPNVLEDDTNNQIWARFQSNHSFRVTAENSGGFSGNTVTVSNNEKFDDGAWHHIVIVYEENNYNGETGKSNVTVYLDGESMGTNPQDGFKDTYTVPYLIGCNNRLTDGAWAPENLYYGLMDNYILYKRALTEEEIKLLSEM